ncbi:MAG: hypothetical protein HQM03_02135 [Magnetococcales bacterium]|nr:hypothetical protein [Magnetococcales bacterium]
MTPREILDRLLLPDFFVPVNGDKAILVESEPMSLIKEIHLSPIPAGSVLLRMDRIDPGDMKKYFGLAGNAGELKRCDYLLIGIYNNIKFILFVELKSEEVKSPDVKEKFYSCECIIDYYCSLLKSFHGLNFNGYKKYYAVVYWDAILKRSTSINGTNQRSVNNYYRIQVNKPVTEIKLSRFFNQ